MTNIRWIIEVNKMRRLFPGFVPFIRNGHAGFEGFLVGREGQQHQITLDVPAGSYPEECPKIFINPWVGSHRYPDGSLCVHQTWRPGKDTFAQQLLYAADYLQQFG